MPAAEAQYVTLGLGAEVFAVPVEFVREILDYRQPFAIPEGPAYLLGLTDVRGRGTATIDLRAKLGLPTVPPGPSTRILVLDIPLEGRLLSLGLVADRVIEVVSVSADQIEPAPDIGVAWRSDYIAGVVRRDDGFVVLFELARLLTTQEAAALPAVADVAA
ncbi:MAG: chemotaxis protein CheW [Alphaproteobacteria bacterium]|nr:chemotaxis protein CheW [Alphaproteobacteria bacterium]MBU1517133.1 chemotaxis protein CheW [Alphaproteobacteria bacterium]MBU2096534.1 chemotaxis protein CheW [Alphaproteobacteria bacterium]MBU2151686.1 chemotaxis protein CheW [Alphaproteobacteria bacterium]MBU2305436.1 chemotaxis protein CheW [Alphaproteobacteria bacterium]